MRPTEELRSLIEDAVKKIRTCVAPPTKSVDAVIKEHGFPYYLKWEGTRDDN